MGIFQSTTNLLSSEEEEEDKTQSYQVLQNHHKRSEEEYSSAKLLTIFSLPSMIYKSLKWLLRKLGSIFFMTKSADPHPLLPVQNPAPAPASSTITTEPLLGKSLPIYDNERGTRDVSQKIICGAGAAVLDLVEENGCRNVCKVREEEERKKKSRHSNSSIINVVVGEESESQRWIKHYSSRHKILLVGEGDFSFSACLAVAFGSSAANIIATSLNSEAFLKKNYGRAMSNLAELRSRGSKVMHEIDATEIARHPLLRRLKFDRIIFNFPFAGFFPDLSPKSQLGRHRSLVSQFLRNAREMISENGGEIHISHKTNGNYHRDFKLEDIASAHRLSLITAVNFDRANYPGYNTKYGFGGDNNFNCVPSKTFIFGLN